VCLQCPTTEQEWLSNADEMLQKWDLPLCLGAMDGKHVRVMKPPNSGSTFFNYKNYFSVNMLGVCDADYKFLFLEVGGQGRLSDGAIWNSSRMKTALENNSLHIPGPSYLPKMYGSSFQLPHFFAADDAFAMSENIMKPYSTKDLNQAQRVFNYRYLITSISLIIHLYLNFIYF
jgi:hypothetical protein